MYRLHSVGGAIVMKINESVSLVGSGKFGHQLTHPLDCNVYLLDLEDGSYALIDAGCGIQPERIVSQCEHMGVPMERITSLLITHAHADHAAGAAYFHNTYGIQVIAGCESAEWLEVGDTEKTSVRVAKAAGVYPADFDYPACPVAVKVKEGDTIRLGKLALQVIETPGHSRGHVSYALVRNGQRWLFAGDAVFTGGRIVIQNIWDCVISDYANTIDKLHALKIDVLFPGHGTFLLQEAWVHVEMAKRYFDKLEIPPNL